MNHKREQDDFGVAVSVIAFIALVIFFFVGGAK